MTNTPSRPHWLPDIVNVIDDSRTSIQRLASIFDLDFRLGRPTFQNCPVWWNDNIVSTFCGDLEYTFWHLISRENQKTKIRYYDIERAKRLSWCAPIIRNSTKSEVKVWDKVDPQGKTKTYLWLEDFDYIVILERLIRGSKGEAVFLISGFYVDEYGKTDYSESYKNANTAP